MKFSAFFFEV